MRRTGLARRSTGAGRAAAAVAVGWSVALAGLLAGAESKPAAAPPATAPAPKTHKVAKAPFRIEVELSGVFEAARATEISVPAEMWTTLRVLDAVEHGATVKKGDVLINLDLRKIDESIRRKQADLRIAELGLKQAVEDLRHTEKTAPEQLAGAVRAQQRAAADLERFTKLDRDEAVKAAAYAVRYRTDVLDYSREELRQLEKMYKADDLTEATEEIVLKRQKDAIERNVYHLAKVKADQDRQLKVVLPRRAEDLATAKRAADEARTSAEAAGPVALAKKRLELARTRREHARSVEDLARLEADRKAMVVRAPHDGVVYYGQCVRGQWATAKAVAGKLVRGGAIAPDQVAMTVVDPARLGVRAAVAEKNLHHLRKGLAGEATPAGYPLKALKVELASLLAAPIAPGQFDAKLTAAGKPGPVMPGMTCKVKLVAYDKADALAVPAAAVLAEKDDPAKRYVHVAKGDGREKRPVKIGREHGGKIEIVEGLAEGETVLLDGGK